LWIINSVAFYNSSSGNSSGGTIGINFTNISSYPGLAIGSCNALTTGGYLFQKNKTYWILNSSSIINTNATLYDVLRNNPCSSFGSPAMCAWLGIIGTAIAASVVPEAIQVPVAIVSFSGFAFGGFFYFLPYDTVWLLISLAILLGVLLISKKAKMI
jgi:hypothetical protein